MKATQRNSVQVRELSFDLAARSAEDETIPVVVSTDAVVDMPDGPEMLVHTPDAIDLKRAPLPIIATHRSNQLNVGVVENLRPVNGQLRGDARFGARQEAAEYRADVLNGIIRSVSVKYQRIKAKIRSDGVLVTSRWMPMHAAMVAEPADSRAGFFRSEQSVLEVDGSNSANAEIGVVVSDEEKAAADAKVTAEREAAARIEAGKKQHDKEFAARAEDERIATIRKYGQANAISEDIVQAWVSRGATYEQIADDILAIQKKRGEKGTNAVSALDLTEREKRQYSLTRAILAANTENWKDAGFELECHTAIAERLNKVPEKGHFFVPLDIQRRSMQTDMAALAQRMGLPYLARDLNTADAAAGGYLVQTSVVSFDEILRNTSVLMRMGATTLPGLRDNVTIPRQSAAATAEWLTTETDTVGESQQTFVQLALSPKTVSAYTEISRKLLLQGSIGVESLVNADLAAVVGLAADLAGLSGTGAGGQPLGLDNVTGVGSVTGTSIAFEDILEFQTDVAAGNVMPVRGGYVTTPAVASLLIQRVKYTNTASPLWEGSIWNGTVQGFPAMSSNQVATAVAYFGDWSKIVVAEWGTLEIDTNPYAGFTAGIIGVRAMYSVDVGVRYPVAFSRAGSIT